ncbi:MAG: hypothetical protein OHK0052_26070 [Anaerolineales bacterium]
MRIKLQQGEVAGWVQIVLETNDGSKIRLWVSNAHTPFDDLLDFLKDIALGAFPCDFEISDEGDRVIWQGLAHPNRPLFRLRVFRKKRSYDDVLLNELLERKTFVRSFYQTLIQFRKEFDSGLWQGAILPGDIDSLAYLLMTWEQSW